MTSPPTRGTRRPRNAPSVRAASLEQARQVLQQDRAEAAARRAERIPGAPPDGQVWFSVAETAVLIGVSRSRIGQWVQAGRLPATRRRRLWWIRRQDAEVAANARRFRQAWGRDPVDLGRG
ncbi:helix-turn-helix domain-containing protein [Nocardioides aquaticus]|uniref:helix-turn-helix domain-containing protein n=1 Tax=Nocardioides aquaticus TaxID=160826 RepID=UPI003B82E935